MFILPKLESAAQSFSRQWLLQIYFFCSRDVLSIIRATNDLLFKDDPPAKQEIQEAWSSSGRKPPQEARDSLLTNMKKLKQ